ncbi:MAG: 50S ribosomal protein L29 [Bacteroidetes bacterium]|nr:50S ribosomal protein L29 [Bacteroidota bacterium]
MRMNEIREMSTEEIEKRIIQEEIDLVDLKFQHELKNLTNTSKLKLVRKDIARMKTVLMQKEIEAQKKAKELK